MELRAARDPGARGYFDSGGPCVAAVIETCDGRIHQSAAGLGAAFFLKVGHFLRIFD